MPRMKALSINGESREIVARNVRALMDEANFRQIDLAKRAHLAQRTISYMLNPDTAVGSSTLESVAKVAAAFKLPTWVLCFDMPADMLRLEEFTRLADLANTYLALPPDSRSQVDRSIEAEKRISQAT